MTTPNVNKSLSDIFDINLTTTDKPLQALQISAKNESIDNLEARREYVKENIVSLIEKGNLALDSMIDIAKSTESHKDYKVLKEMIEALVKTNMTLLESEVVHKEKPETDKDSPSTVNNTAVFVGSTADLSNYLNNLSRK